MDRRLEHHRRLGPDRRKFGGADGGVGRLGGLESILE
jgi:hypothetical protein